MSTQKTTEQSTSNEAPNEEAVNEEQASGVEEDTGTAGDQESTPDGEQEESNEESGNEAGSGDEDSNDDGGDDAPAWIREKLTKANGEAANYRTKLREAEDKLKNAKTPDEVDEIVTQMTQDRETAERGLLIENVALKHKLPETLLKRLTGTTREELEADAKELAELFGADEYEDDGPLEGGLAPRGRNESASDPRSLAREHGGRKRR